LTRPLPSVGFRLEFGPQRTYINTIDLAKVDDLAPGLRLWYRVKSALQDSPPKTIAALAEELSEKVDSVDKAIKRKATGKDAIFSRVTGPDGIARVALMERRYAYWSDVATEDHRDHNYTDGTEAPPEK
jgi:hypothetical protein